MEKSFGGIIERWEIHKLTGGRGAVFTGTVIEGSPIFDDGFHMRSSPIKRIQKVDGLFAVETKNRIYHLRGPRGDKRIPFRGDAALSLVY